MTFRRLAFLFCLQALFFFSALGQGASPTESQSDKEKTKKELEERAVHMLDQAVGDASSLKLPQNRAVVYGMAGDLYWKFDAKRARELFRNAAGEILTFNSETEKERKDNTEPYYEFFGNDVRSEVLSLVAKHDADLALEMLLQTRPANLSEAMARHGRPDARQEGGGYFSFDPDRRRVQQEIALEQRFALLAADDNPDRAIKLIKDSLSKGISWNVMPLLQKLYKKDEKKASALADDVIKKIVETDLTKRNEDLNAAIGMLQNSTNPNRTPDTKEKVFKFSDAQLKDLGNKIANTFLQPSNSLGIAMSMARVMPSLEKVVPERAVLLKQRQAELTKNMPPELRSMQRQQKLWNMNSTPEEILAEIPKLNEIEKRSAYQSLANRIGSLDDDARAKRLIDQIPDEKARENAADAYESGKISRASKDGKLDDARKMISNLTKKKTQIQKLVALAMEFHKKGTEEDIKTAASLMKDAKGLANEYPEDEDELGDLMEVVKGYAIVDPDEAFRIFEPIVDQINDFVQASAILSKYNKRNRAFKRGELVMRSNGFSWDGFLLFRYATQMQMLGKADLNRMSTLSDRFQRGDSRTIVKLFVAQGFLKDEKKPEGDGVGGGIVFMDF